MNPCSTPSGRGEFATARRGGLTSVEIREIEAHRAKDRPTPWQALARRYGRPESDIKALFIKPDNDDKAMPPAWPFGECDAAVQAVIRSVAIRHGVSLDEMSSPQVGGRHHIWTAQRDCYATVRDVFPNIRMVELAAIFRRDPKVLHKALAIHDRQAAA